MSADAYSQCPKCISGIDPKLLRALEEIRNAGGDGTIPGNEETLRQDYDISFEPETRQLHVNFRARCRECSWTYSFKQTFEAPL